MTIIGGRKVANFTPQEIEEMLQAFFDTVGKRQYIGARYVPIFGRRGEGSIEWNNSAPYEPLTVVMHEGVSYVSKQYVPAGVDIYDAGYWAETYRFNAQVEQYRQEVLSFQEQIDTLRTDLESDYVPFPDSDTYPKYGTLGQVLTTLADGETKWDDPVVVDATIAEPLIDAWLEDHPEATTTVEDGAITNAKLNANGVIRWSSAYFISYTTNVWTYNITTHILTTQNCAIFVHGTGHAYTGQTIDVSSVLTNQACVFAVNSSYEIYAKAWSGSLTNKDDAIIGYIYGNHVHLNGIDDSLIDVVDNDGINYNIVNKRENAYIFSQGIGSYNTSTHVLTVPQGYFVLGNYVAAFTATTLDLTDYLNIGACVLLLDKNGTLKAAPYNAHATLNKPIYTDAVVGAVYDWMVHINGLSEFQIDITGIQRGNRYKVPNSFMGYVGVRDGFKVTYDYSTKILTLPAGFTYQHGAGIARNANTTIDGSSVISSDAFMVAIVNGEYVAQPWGNYTNLARNTAILGYVYHNYVYLNGVDPSMIEVVNYTGANMVYCFGDSITAGVGATTLYHMLWHKWDNKNRFKNYGVGSTGYVVTTSSEVLVGNGVEGKGSSQQESGNNSVLEIMQSVTDDMYAITISAGTNDWRGNTPAATFRSAVRTAIEYAQSITPRVFVMTPIRRQRGTEPTTNTEGLTVEDYGDIIIEECISHGVAYSNGYDVAINPANTVSYNNFTTDGLHPNDAGQARMARYYYNTFLEMMGQ